MAAQSMIDAAEFDPFTRESIVWDHPVDRLEPEIAPADAIRDARLMTVHLLNDFAVEMLSALTSENPARSALIRLFRINYAMGLSIASDGIPMSARADQLGCERAALSKIATAWNTAHDLRPSHLQKSVEANEEYARARREAVQSSNGMTPHKKAQPFKSMHDLPAVPPRDRSV
jgi:hypothetical protein